jgi:putative endonuclease
MSLLQSIRLAALEQTLLSLRRAAGKHARVPSLPAHLEMGERGEETALFHLRCEGYVVVARRWKSAKQRGDIDLIAWEADTLCFIEVKTRGGHDVATAESAVDEDKRQVLRRLARVYLKTIEPAPQSVRFDLLSVYFDGGRCESMLFRGAFGW